MKQGLKNFYSDIVRNPAYWLPVLIFTIAAFGFNLFNRTGSQDFFTTRYYNNVNLGDRWGFPVFGEILGLYDLNPPLDKFLALLFLVLSGIGISFLFFRTSEACMPIGNGQKNKNNVWGYSILTIIFITYPLINTIWEYYGANYAYTGGLLTGILAICVMNAQSIKRLWRFIIAGVLMVFPVTTYEASVASYITIVSLLVFYEYVLLLDKTISCRKWLGLMWPYAIPIILAVSVRFVVTFSLCQSLGIEHVNVGDSAIRWFSLGLSSIINMADGYYYHWILRALVYFPITEYTIAIVLFIVTIIVLSIRRQSIQPLLLGVVVVLSTFSLSIIQGSMLQYRMAQPVAIFVAFVVFIVSNKIILSRNIAFKYISMGLIVLLGWHQATYLNKLLALDNLRSDNEAAIIQQIGMRLLSEYDEKPVIFVSSVSLSGWIDQRICADTTTWNGSLYKKCVKRYFKLAPILADVKYIGSNVANYTRAYWDIQDAFSYYGFDINVIGPTAYPFTPDRKKPQPILEEATRIAREKKMKPYEIMDNGDYIIVQLSGEEYFIE